MMTLLLASILAINPRMTPIRTVALPECATWMEAGTPCLFVPPVTVPDTSLRYHVELVQVDPAAPHVTGTIVLDLPPGHEFRHLDWQMYLEASDGPACPELLENNREFNGFSRIFIACSPGAAPLQTQAQCSQPPYTCRPEATGCYLLQNQNPGQGPDSVCVYKP